MSEVFPPIKLVKLVRTTVREPRCIDVSFIEADGSEREIELPIEQLHSLSEVASDLSEVTKYSKDRGTCLHLVAEDARAYLSESGETVMWASIGKGRRISFVLKTSIARGLSEQLLRSAKCAKSDQT